MGICDQSAAAQWADVYRQAADPHPQRSFVANGCDRQRPLQSFFEKCQKFWAVTIFAGKIQENRSGFLGRFKEARGKSKSPGPQMISICVLTLTRTSLTAEYYSAQVHLNGMERYRQVCRMHRIICAWPHSSSAIFSSMQRCVPAFSASASYASCAACSSE